LRAFVFFGVPYHPLLKWVGCKVYLDYEKIFRVERSWRKVGKNVTKCEEGE